jgi:hypothetical protein
MLPKDGNPAIDVEDHLPVGSDAISAHAGGRARRGRRSAVGRRTRRAVGCATGGGSVPVSYTASISISASGNATSRLSPGQAAGRAATRDAAAAPATAYAAAPGTTPTPTTTRMHHRDGTREHQRPARNVVANFMRRLPYQCGQGPNRRRQTTFPSAQHDEMSSFARQGVISPASAKPSSATSSRSDPSQQN